MKAGRKATGGRYKRPKKRKKSGRQKEAHVAEIGDRRTKLIRGRGKTKKLIAFKEDEANVTNDKISQISKIKNVIETPANTFLARQNILVKGAIIDTDLGKAKITNRPSQEGNVQAVIVE